MVGARDWLIVFAKRPLRGLAKTRLARDIGLDYADALAQAFLVDTLALGMRCSGVQLMVAFTPSTARAWFEGQAPSAELFAQPEQLFGVRIQVAMREAFKRGARRCVMIGTDTPQLEPQTISRAFGALAAAEVCLGPSHYYLIGLGRDQPMLFEDVPWSTDRVLAVTLQRAAAAGLSVGQLALESDVGEGADLEALGSILAQRPSVAAALPQRCRSDAGGALANETGRALSVAGAPGRQDFPPFWDLSESGQDPGGPLCR